MVLTGALHCLISKWKNMMHLPHIFTLSMCFLCPSNTTLIPSHAKKPSLTLAEHCKTNHHTTIRLGKAVPHTSGTQQDKPPHYHPSPKSRTQHTRGTQQDKPPHYHPFRKSRPSHQRNTARQTTTLPSVSGKPP